MIVNFPSIPFSYHLDNNKQPTHAYGVQRSHLARYDRACSLYSDCFTIYNIAVNYDMTFCVTKITYIMYSVQDYSFLCNDAVRSVICED